MKSNKNDFVDAEAIAEAVERKNMRFVPIKTDDQLNLQANLTLVVARWIIHSQDLCSTTEEPVNTVAIGESAIKAKRHVSQPNCRLSHKPLQVRELSAWTGLDEESKPATIELRI